MKTIKRFLIGVSLACLIYLPVSAQKHLVFLDGYLGWYYSLPPYLLANHEALEELPYSGFTVVGNYFTSYVMSADPNTNNVTYPLVWWEVGSLKEVFRRKTDNFLRINLDFPGDFWDDAVWQKTTNNFASVAKAAKNLGFKGIMFDDEVYANGQHIKAHYMSNFKFPRRQDVIDNPENYEDWEISESMNGRGDHVDYWCYIDGLLEADSENCAYRNPNYSFKEHMDKVASRFKTIMLAMQAEFPDITLLVLHGPATSHKNTNTVGHYIKPNALYDESEYKGAMFLGFRQGLNNQATLHDLGELYQYKTDADFENAYQWRKFDIADQAYNASIDDTFEWVIPVNDGVTWSEDVSVGFMVSDYGLPFNPRGDYDTTGLCNPPDVETRLTKALNRTDDYVVYYSDSNLSDCLPDLPWMNADIPKDPAWVNMMQGVYNSIAPEKMLVRRDLAKKVLEQIEGTDYVPPDADGNEYNDVAAEDINADWIEEFKSRGFTEGCALGKFCPDMIVTKEQMAKIMLKVKSVNPLLPNINNTFYDVPVPNGVDPDSFAWDYITVMRDLNYSDGCKTTLANEVYYCPQNAVSWRWFYALLSEI